jgi:hypothetical protein
MIHYYPIEKEDEAKRIRNNSKSGLYLEAKKRILLCFLIQEILDENKFLIQCLAFKIFLRYSTKRKSRKMCL